MRKSWRGIPMRGSRSSPAQDSGFRRWRSFFVIRSFPLSCWSMTIVVIWSFPPMIDSEAAGLLWPSDLLRSFKRGVVEDGRGGSRTVQVGGGSGSIMDTDLLYLLLASWVVINILALGWAESVCWSTYWLSAEKNPNRWEVIAHLRSAIRHQLGLDRKGLRPDKISFRTFQPFFSSLFHFCDKISWTFTLFFALALYSISVCTAMIPDIITIPDWISYCMYKYLSTVVSTLILFSQLFLIFSSFRFPFSLQLDFVHYMCPVYCKLGMMHWNSFW